MASAQLISGLEQQGVDYRLALIHTPKHPFIEAAFPKSIRERIVLTHKVNTSGIFLNIKAFTNERYSLFTARFFNPHFAHQLLDYCQKEKPDIIHFESLFAAVYCDVLKTQIKAKYVLRSHNVEHQLWEDRAKSMNCLKRVILKKQIAQLKHEEVLALTKMDGIAAIAKNEIEFIASNKITTPGIWLPMGVQHSNNLSQFGNDFFHLGAMDWTPNRRAVQWFMANVWTTYPARKQNILHLAGKGLHEEDFKMLGVKNHGTVCNSQKFMCEHGIMVAPLFEGSGLRIKVIEAAAIGVPIIATSKAVEGIGLVSGTHYFEANSAEAFKEAMLLLSNDVSLRRKIGEALRDFVQKHFNQEDLNRKLTAFYRGI